MRQYTVNKGSAISRPQPGCHLPNSPWPGIIYPIPVPGRFGQKKSRNLEIFYYSVPIKFVGFDPEFAYVVVLD
jgi:hypothetical protein